MGVNDDNYNLKQLYRMKSAIDYAIDQHYERIRLLERVAELERQLAEWTRLAQEGQSVSQRGMLALGLALSGDVDAAKLVAMNLKNETKETKGDADQ